MLVGRGQCCRWSYSWFPLVSESKQKRNINRLKRQIKTLDSVLIVA